MEKAVNTESKVKMELPSFFSEPWGGFVNGMIHANKSYRPHHTGQLNLRDVPTPVLDFFELNDENANVIVLTENGKRTDTDGVKLETSSYILKDRCVTYSYYPNTSILRTITLSRGELDDSRIASTAGKESAQREVELLFTKDKPVLVSDKKVIIQHNNKTNKQESVGTLNQYLGSELVRAFAGFSDDHDSKPAKWFSLANDDKPSFFRMADLIHWNILDTQVFPFIPQDITLRELNEFENTYKIYNANWGQDVQKIITSLSGHGFLSGLFYFSFISNTSNIGSFLGTKKNIDIDVEGIKELEYQMIILKGKNEQTVTIQKNIETKEQVIVFSDGNQINDRLRVNRSLRVYLTNEGKIGHLLDTRMEKELVGNNMSTKVVKYGSEDEDGMIKPNKLKLIGSGIKIDEDCGQKELNDNEEFIGLASFLFLPNDFYIDESSSPIYNDHLKPDFSLSQMPDELFNL